MRVIATVFMLTFGATAALAQQPAPDLDAKPDATKDAILRNSPDLKLSPEQKQTIYTSVSSMPAKETAPPTFRAAIGEAVPASIELKPLPPTIVDLMPQTKDYHYAMVTNQVLLVDSGTRRIVDVISH